MWVRPHALVARSFGSKPAPGACHSVARLLGELSAVEPGLVGQIR